MLIYGTQFGLAQNFSFLESRLVFAVEENASNFLDYIPNSEKFSVRSARNINKESAQLKQKDAFVSALEKLRKQLPIKFEKNIKEIYSDSLAGVNDDIPDLEDYIDSDNSKKKDAEILYSQTEIKNYLSDLKIKVFETVKDLQAKKAIQLKTERGSEYSQDKKGWIHSFPRYSQEKISEIGEKLDYANIDTKPIVLKMQENITKINFPENFDEPTKRHMKRHIFKIMLSVLNTGVKDINIEYITNEFVQNQLLQPLIEKFTTSLLPSAQLYINFQNKKFREDMKKKDIQLFMRAEKQVKIFETHVVSPNYRNALTTIPNNIYGNETFWNKTKEFFGGKNISEMRNDNELSKLEINKKKSLENVSKNFDPITFLSEELEKDEQEAQLFVLAGVVLSMMPFIGELIDAQQVFTGSDVIAEWLASNGLINPRYKQQVEGWEQGLAVIGLVAGATIVGGVAFKGVKLARKLAKFPNLDMEKLKDAMRIIVEKKGGSDADAKIDEVFEEAEYFKNEKYPPTFNEDLLEAMNTNARKKIDVKKGKEFSKQYATQERKIKYVNIMLEKDKKLRKEMLNNFYIEQARIAKLLAKEIKSGERDISKISKELDCTFFHTIAIDEKKSKIKGLGDKKDNNIILNHEAITNEKEVQTILSLQPTLSASVLSNNIQHSKYLFGDDNIGVIITKGNLMAVNEYDMKTFPSGLYSRRVKTKGENPYLASNGILPSQNKQGGKVRKITEGDTDFQYSSVGGGMLNPEFDNFETGSIQRNVRSHSRMIIERQVTNNTKELKKINSVKHNEVIIENPKIGGLFLKVDGLDTHFSEDEIAKIFIEKGLTYVKAKENAKNIKNILKTEREKDLRIAINLSVQTNMPLYVLKNGKKYKLTKNGVNRIDKIKTVSVRKKEKKEFIENNKQLFKGKQATKDIRNKLKEISREKDEVSIKQDLPINLSNIINKKEIYTRVESNISESDDIIDLKSLYKLFYGPDFSLRPVEYELMKKLFLGKSEKEVLEFISQDVVNMENDQNIYSEYLELITG